MKKPTARCSARVGLREIHVDDLDCRERKPGARLAQLQKSNGGAPRRDSAAVRPHPLKFEPPKPRNLPAIDVATILATDEGRALYCRGAAAAAKARAFLLASDLVRDLHIDQTQAARAVAATKRAAKGQDTRTRIGRIWDSLSEVPEHERVAMIAEELSLGEPYVRKVIARAKKNSG